MKQISNVHFEKEVYIYLISMSLYFNKGLEINICQQINFKPSKNYSNLYDRCLKGEL